MQKNVVKFAKYSALALALGLASGCASTDTMKAIEDNAAAAKQAQDTASQALSTAKEASRKADAAMRAASEAQACCDQNRMSKRTFEEKMRK